MHNKADNMTRTATKVHEKMGGDPHFNEQPVHRNKVKTDRIFTSVHIQMRTRMCMRFMPIMPKLVNFAQAQACLCAQIFLTRSKQTYVAEDNGQLTYALIIACIIDWKYGSKVPSLAESTRYRGCAPWSFRCEI